MTALPDFVNKNDMTVVSLEHVFSVGHVMPGSVFVQVVCVPVG